MAYAGAPVDGRDEEQESQHGTFPEASLGLERMIRYFSTWFPFWHIPL